MIIGASLVKELREKTGIGMMECKKALEETNGDIEEAVEYLRKHNKNLTKVINRVASEGLCKSMVFEKDNIYTGIIMELNTETDFAARTDVISKLSNKLLEIMFETDVDDILSTVYQSEIDEAIAILGEKIELKRFEKIRETFNHIYAYTHNNRISVLVAYHGDNIVDGTLEIVKNIALQITSMAPEYVGLSDIPIDVRKKEKEIITEQVNTDSYLQNKPEDVKNGIIIGRLKKNLKAKCLLDQVYVKAEDHKQTVSEYLDEIRRKYNIEFEITNFIRYELGEGADRTTDYNKQQKFVEEIGMLVDGVKKVDSHLGGTIAIAKDEKYFSEETKKRGEILDLDETLR